MNKCDTKTAAFWLLLMVSCILLPAFGRAQAQDAREAVLALSVGPDLVPPVSLQGALEAELGVAVALTEQPDFAAPTVTVSRLDSGNVEVALSSRSLPRATRQLVLSSEIEAERVETLALIAANLVRNEAAALLPDLRPAKVASVDVATPAPTPAPEPARAPASEVDDPCALQPRGGFGFDFAPGVGASSAPEQRKAPRRFSLGLIGALHGPLHGAELSIGVNIARGPVCGAQFALANVALGSVTGAQFAQFNLARGSLRGAQFGILNLSTGRARGLQAAIVSGAGGGLHGAQLGILNYTREDSQGMQGAVANLSVGSFRGAQLGVGNLIVGDLRGAQLGTANITTGAADVQLGVFNYADRSKASIGVLSIVRHGRTSIDLTGGVESGLLLAGVTHGGKYVHNVLGIGARHDDQGNRLAVQLGLGVRVLSRDRVRVDVDALTTHLWRDGGRDSFIAGARVPVTVQLVRGLGVLVAPSYSVLISDDPREDATPLLGRSVLHRAEQPGDTKVIGYPGVTFGLRYEFDHGV